MNLLKSMKKILFVAAITTMLPLLAACGGNGNGSTPKTYTVGGTVAGLNGTLSLQNNGGNFHAVSTNGPFTFSGLANGAAYNITVYFHPHKQICTVQNGSGTIRSADITDIRVVCTNSAGVALRGRIAVPSGVVIDGSVNDLNEKYVYNGAFGSAQILPNPISVGGYVNRRLAGSYGRSYSSGNPDDYYHVQLKAGDIITLAIGESDTRLNDLNICLYDTPGDDPVDCSIGTGTYEILTTPSDGTYFVKVYATSGASNYILTIGADMSTAAIAAADPEILSTQREMVPDQVVVLFKDTVKTASSTNRLFSQYAADMGLAAVAGSPERDMLMSIGDLKFQADNTDAVYTTSYERKTTGDSEKTRLLNTLNAIKELRKQPDILSAEPNYIVRAYSNNPNDSHYGFQWNLPMIGTPEAWNVTTGGDNVIVAVVDSGVLMNHPDLAGQLTNTGYNFVSAGGIGPNPNDPGDKEPGTIRSSFHGTHVAGIIAAKTNNNTGVAGITWNTNTKIMPVRVMGAGGSGTIYDVRQGIRYAAGMDNDSKTYPPKHADIINLSLGSAGHSAVDQTLFDDVRKKGIIVIAAAGNENTSIPSYPAAYNGVISVSAVNINGTRASYSNYGSTIKVAAPGGDSGDYNGDGYPDFILSTCGDDSSGSVANVYTFMAGTSMAAPHVAGVAALMKAAYPGLTPQDMDGLLAVGKITNNIGASNYYGYGLINAYTAVAAARELAGGGSITGFDVNPRTINLGVLNSAATITLSKIGTDELSIAGVDTNADWLTVAGGSVDGSGFGSYVINVDRFNPSLRQGGAYTAVVTFTASSEISVSIGVTIQVRSNDVTYDAGHHYVLLLRVKDDDTFEIADQLGVRASGGYYAYAFTNVPPGRYRIIAGSDRNNNSLVGDGGEVLGAYPTLEQMIVIEVTDSDKNNLDFTTNLILPISNTNIAMDDITAADKQDSGAVQAEFERLPPWAEEP